MPEVRKLPEFTTQSAGNGTCWLCHAARRKDDQFVLDLGINIDFEGQVEICHTCVNYLASFSDYAAPQYKRLLEGQVRNLKEENAALQERVAALEPLESAAEAFLDAAGVRVVAK